MDRNEFLNSVVQKVLVTSDTDATFEPLAEYVPGSMMDPGYDAFEMLQFELMAISARSKYGINIDEFT